MMRCEGCGHVTALNFTGQGVCYARVVGGRWVRGCDLTTSAKMSCEVQKALGWPVDEADNQDVVDVFSRLFGGQKK